MYQTVAAPSKSVTDHLSLHHRSSYRSARAFVESLCFALHGFADS
jgi:hypothetical protein